MIKAINMLDMRKEGSESYHASVKAATEYLVSQFYTTVRPSEATVACLGHTHIDVAWLWTLAVTEDKSVRSFSTVLELMKQYPQYFGLDASDGLYLYVCQFAPTHYSVHLTQYPEDETGSPLEFRIDGGIYVHQMREILATYDIDADDVTVIPWQPMHSSYVAPYFIYKIGEKEETQQRYIEGIKGMLFDAEP
jgi:hypothetical protein